MTSSQFNELASNRQISDQMYDLMKDLFGICRSITGNGVRKSLDMIKKYADVDVHEVKSGTRVFDWTVPKEWNIKDAYVLDPEGKKIIDFTNSNLHIVSYSTPINKKMNLADLKPHLHTLPEQPEVIPYLTSYYNENWGFCLRHSDFLQLKEGEYQVFIDSTLQDGSLTYGEYLLKGNNKEEILISCYVCHPSMCNDNLSGIVITTMLAHYLKNIRLNHSIRFLFIPETIGAITWLSLNEKDLSNIKHGLVITCAGDPGISTYKKSRRGDAQIDKTVEYVLKKSGSPYNIVDFFPTGSDERQFCSPGFNLPVGSIMRTMYSKFQEYHTSADNLDFVKKEALFDTFLKCLKTIFILDNNNTYTNLNPKCEPQLGKRGLYRSTGGQKVTKDTESAIFWILNLSDGKNTLLDIAERSDIDFTILLDTALNLESKGLLKSLQTG